MEYSTDQIAVATILVVDDQATNRELLQDTLIDHGFRVKTTSSGKEAYRILKETKIDLVLLDIVMPEKNGFEICRDIKSNSSTYLIPIVFITALSDKESRIQGIQAGADDLLTLPVDPIELLARVRSLLRLKQRTDELERAESVLFTLALIVESRDPNIHGHCARISHLSGLLGEHLGLPAEEVAALRLGGVVHDIGKVKIPDGILLKPGPLSKEEWAVMREHPTMGERICAPLKSFRLVLPIIRHHHEKRDGSGYPDGLRGDDIPITARILQVVDIYDALKSVRPYKCAMSTPEAIRTMREEVGKGWWDPNVLNAFEHLLKEDGPDLQALPQVIEYAQDRVDRSPFRSRSGFSTSMPK
jgi:putative two-component system response regulator